jgi:hypothetical protein
MLKPNDRVRFAGLAKTTWMPITAAGYFGTVIKVTRNGFVKVRFDGVSYPACVKDDSVELHHSVLTRVESDAAWFTGMNAEGLATYVFPRGF